MKSYETIVLAVYAGIISDAAARWPNHQPTLEKDSSYLLSYVKHRGLSFFTITLPSAAKCLMQALDRGSLLEADAFPQGITLKSPNRPALFSCLFDEVFDSDGLLRRDACPDAAFYLLQLFTVAKKARLECKPSAVKETLDEFFAIEDKLPPSHPDTWSSDTPRWERRTGHPLYGGDRSTVGSAQSNFDSLVSPVGSSSDLPWDDLYAHAQRIVRGFIGDIPIWDIQPKHGPGAIADGHGRTVKYDFPTWPTKLEGIFPYDWFGAGDLSPARYPSDREPPSVLHAVPKTQKGPRLICAEPVAHQWIQQGICRWLESRFETTLLGASIKLRDQGLQRTRCIRSSRDASLCTIDLSSASDRISTRLVEYIFQFSNLIDALHASRTRYCTQTISAQHPKMVELRKFSTQGSAVTFPIQTIIFFILSTWAVRLVESGWEPGVTNWVRPKKLASKGQLRSVSVYGDDIIAPTSAYNTIKLVLHECGLKVNTAKTFAGSCFRESCGMYAFQGYDITPAYLLEAYDGSPESLAATVESSNNFHIRGLWKTADIIANQFPPQELSKLYVTDLGRSGGLGLVSFVGASTLHLRVGWDRNLQREYVKILTTTSKSQRIKGTGESSLSQYFFEDPSSAEFSQYESGRAGRPKLRKCLGRVYL